MRRLFVVFFSLMVAQTPAIAADQPTPAPGPRAASFWPRLFDEPCWDDGPRPCDRTQYLGNETVPPGQPLLDAWRAAQSDSPEAASPILDRLIAETPNAGNVDYAHAWAMRAAAATGQWDRAGASWHHIHRHFPGWQTIGANGASRKWAHLLELTEVDFARARARGVKVPELVRPDPILYGYLDRNISDFSKAYALIHEYEPDHLTALKLLEPYVCATPPTGDSRVHYELAEHWANVCREHLGQPPRRCPQRRPGVDGIEGVR